MEKLQFIGTSPIHAIFCVVIALDERGSEHVLFLLGREYIMWNSEKKVNDQYADLT